MCDGQRSISEYSGRLNHVLTEQYVFRIKIWTAVKNPTHHLIAEVTQVSLAMTVTENRRHKEDSSYNLEEL